MTDLEKRIYNKHLAVSRSLRNKPFKLKGDFTGFEENPKYPSFFVSYSCYKETIKFSNRWVLASQFGN